MNSSLQCLSHTLPLTYYLLSGQWEKDLNQDNPLGMNGEVAKAFVSLIESLWALDASTSVAPREFKMTIVLFFMIDSRVNLIHYFQVMVNKILKNFYNRVWMDCMKI